jgi:small subunit ribosomal protein S4
MINQKCKICRRAGEKLFLKEEKCYTPKCPLARKSYPPGAQKRGAGKRPRRVLSEYGFQLREKQKLKFFYLLRERQFKNYIQEALKGKGSDIVSRLAEILELRLDNVVYRLGFTKSRSVARQLVSHGHIAVNGRKTDIPSYRLKVGDKITIRPQSASKKIFQDIDIYFKKYQPPIWLELSKEKKEGKVRGKPQAEDIEVKTNLNAIVEFYSR